MPFDGNGTYVPPAPPTFPAVNGTLIRSDYFNTIINDIAVALSDTLTRDGQASPTAEIDFNNKNLTNVDALDATSVDALNYFVNGGALAGHDIVNALPAGANLREQLISEFIEANYLQPSQFAGTEQQRLVRAITEAGTVRGASLGDTVLIPRDLITVTTPFNMDNRARLLGLNKRGSIIQADATHTGPSMITVVNGTSSTFDNRIEELNLDCNDVAGLSGIIASAWQEGGGIRDCLINKFRGVGLDIVNTYGGVAQLLISGAEFSGSSLGATAGIRFDDPSVASSSILIILNTTITGGGVPAAPGNPAQQATARASMPAALDIPSGSSTIIGLHGEVAESLIKLDGNGRHTIIGCKGSAPNGVDNAGVGTVVEIASTFTGTLTMIGCSRNGAINFLVDNRVGGYGTISYDIPFFTVYPEPAFNPGSDYAYGTFDGSTVGSPSISSCRGLSGITRVSAGVWDVTLTRSVASTAQIIPYGVCTNINGVEPPKVSILGVNSFRIELRTLGGTPIDSNEVKFSVKLL